ncbi:MAG TPA: S53 family peptidase [Pseudonocardia sp.]|jgi:kumamolisin
MSEPDHPLELRALPGSERPAATGSRPRVTLPADTPVEASLVLRRRAEPPDLAVIGRAGPVHPIGPITPAELAERYGADPADVRTVSEVLTGLGARVLETNAAARLVRIGGSAELLGRLFGTSLTPAAGAAGGQRRRSGGLSVPAELDGVVTAVLGLDDRPQARTRFRTVLPSAVTSSYTPPQLGQVYRFPAGTDGTGQTLAIVELGGGFAQSELDTYFGSLGLRPPPVRVVGLDGATNRPGQDPDGADGEVLLDIEVAGALAPGAQLQVYFAPNTDAGFLDAVVRATHATPTPAAISISWGQSEDGWTAQARTAMDQAFADAAALGVTVTAAAGDDGSSDRAADGRPHVDFPASSPHVLACGGTSLAADPDTGAVTSEVVWNNGPGQGATGGGISRAFPRPGWQPRAGSGTGATADGRGVPDVAAVADPRTGYRIRVDGRDGVIGGTSAVAPLWAALAARLAQATGSRLGLLQPALYAAAGADPAGFRDITSGSNGAYTAGPGWDPCTGLGVPVGEALLSALRAGSQRGRPESPLV